MIPTTTIQAVVIESQEPRDNLARLLSDFAYARRTLGAYSYDRHGAFTRAHAAWLAATGEYISVERLVYLCNLHAGTYGAHALECS